MLSLIEHFGKEATLFYWIIWILFSIWDHIYHVHIFRILIWMMQHILMETQIDQSENSGCSYSICDLGQAAVSASIKLLWRQWEHI